MLHRHEPSIAVTVRSPGPGLRPVRDPARGRRLHLGRLRADVEPGEWYMVAFRSIRRPGVDEARLTAYDDWAHAEAMDAPGFVHYFKGPTQPDGRCMSFCLWDSRAEARAAAGRPAHIQAAALTLETYAEYTLEFHRVARLDGRRLHVRAVRRAPRLADRRAERDRGAQAEAGTVLTQRVRDREWRAIDRTRARGGGRRRPRRPARHRVPAVDRRRGHGRPPARDRRRGGRRPAPRAADTGPRVRSQRVLRLGIVLLGARLSLAEIARIGLPATGLIVVTMAASFAIVLLVARLVRVEDRLAVLIAVGSAVCGNTAIVATAPVIGARPARSPTRSRRSRCSGRWRSSSTRRSVTRWVSPSRRSACGPGSPSTTRARSSPPAPRSDPRRSTSRPSSSSSATR